MKKETLFKFIFIFIILILFGIVFDKLIRERASIKEGATGMDDDNNAVKEVKLQKIPGQVKTRNANLLKLRLMDYCIKGSYNTAFSGNYVSKEMVKHVLSRGVRFIDFQVFYLPPTGTAVEVGSTSEFGAYVGYTDKKTSFQPDKVKNNKLPSFGKMLYTVLDQAFVNKMGDEYRVKNPKDPLFLQIRMRTEDSNKPALFEKIQETLRNYLASSPYAYGSKTVSRFTKLSQIKQKLIVVFDSDDYYLVRRKGFNKSDYVNMLSNSESLKRFTFSEMNRRENKIANIVPPKTLTEDTTDVSDFKMAVPDNDIRGYQPNPNPFLAIKLYGCQIIMNQYYSVDDNLINLENMFNERGLGIIPLSHCLSYINIVADPEQTKA
jgi:hypothetical protein